MAETNTTIIGESILISGALTGDEDLTVLGRVHGTVSLTKTLVVEESGIVKADIEVRNAVISGVLVGNIVASDSVEILEKGRVVGDIKAPRVIIVDGARFRGNVDMGNLEAPRASGPLPSKTVERSSMGRPAMAAPQKSSAPAKKALPAAPAPAPAKRVDKPAATVPVMAPVAGKKKLKKQVVVKKKS